ncbi:unnamed protein product [Nezara viridula]|uniref:Uncharacterized protein n=1 Tax=Nezara viridula TaxID=85310 RepID=A0A9P0HJ71_NEZVI|nr:unnamed protein product [Nezara viridula]
MLCELFTCTNKAIIFLFNFVGTILLNAVIFMF